MAELIFSVSWTNHILILDKNSSTFSKRHFFWCLNTNPDLAGHDDASPLCGDEWCWVSASTGAPAGGQFKIFTIKKPGAKPYDIASNGEGWQTCDAKAYEKNTGYEPFDPNFVEGLSADDILKSAHRYRCYDEGDHYSWAEIFS